MRLYIVVHHLAIAIDIHFHLFMNESLVYLQRGQSHVAIIAYAICKHAGHFNPLVIVSYMILCV